VREVTEEEKASFRTLASQTHELSKKHKNEIEATPHNMEAVWEAERLGYGEIIGYHVKQ
jgi:hypothetical protein